MIHWVEFLSIPCNCYHLHRWKKHQSLKGFAFVVHDEVSFLDLQFLAANPFISMFVYQVTPSSIATSTSMDRLRAALLLVIYVISLFKVVELTLLMNVN